MSSLENLESSMQKDIDRFIAQQDKPQSLLPVKRSKPDAEANGSTPKHKEKKKVWTPKTKPNHRITLSVRKKEIAHNEKFVFESTKLSKLEAELEARKAANSAGFPIIAYVEEWEYL